MSTPRPTPRPWKVTHHEHAEIAYIRCALQDGILRGLVCGPLRTEEAVYIVQACNSHDALLAAAEDAEAGFIELANYLQRQGSNPELAIARAGQLHAAIAQTEKGGI